MDTPKRRGKRETDGANGGTGRAAGQDVRHRRKPMEQIDSDSKPERESIESVEDECEEVGPDGGYGGIGINGSELEEDLE